MPRRPASAALRYFRDDQYAIEARGLSSNNLFAGGRLRHYMSCYADAA